MPNRPTIRLAALARAARIVHLRDAGETWAVIAAAHGMTRQRAAQVYAWGEQQRLAAFAKRDTDTLMAMARSEQTDAEDAAWDRFAQEQVTPTTEG